jgi:hypothetical protein
MGLLLNEPKDCNINGIPFASLGAAARHFEVTPQAISYLVKKRGRVVTGYKPSNKNRAVTIDGKPYKSIASASRLLKIPYEKLYAMLK